MHNKIFNRAKKNYMYSRSSG